MYTTWLKIFLNHCSLVSLYSNCSTSCSNWRQFQFRFSLGFTGNESSVYCRSLWLWLLLETQTIKLYFLVLRGLLLGSTKIKKCLLLSHSKSVWLLHLKVNIIKQYNKAETCECRRETKLRTTASEWADTGCGSWTLFKKTLKNTFCPWSPAETWVEAQNTFVSEGGGGIKTPVWTQVGSLWPFSRGGPVQDVPALSRGRSEF